jgi:hypothetical protein
MPAVAFAIPLLTGKTGEAREALASCAHGERSPEYESSRERLGIRREAVWIQPTPGGDISVVYLEADDLESALGGMGTSDAPFDRWFRDHARNVHGIALEEGFPPPEQVLDFRR